MGATHYSGPLYSGGSIVMPGVPFAGAIRGGSPGGKTLYVCSLGGFDEKGISQGFGDGSSPKKPLATLAGATGALARLNNRQNRGDVIYVLPGHSENFSAADYLSDTGTAAGFSIIGLGSGSGRPTFNWTAATSTWLVDTANVEIANCILNLCGSTATGTLTVATPITVSAAGFRMVNCLVNWGQDTDTGCGSTLGAIALVAATDCDFFGNVFQNLDTAGTLAVTCISANGADRLRFIGNKVFGGTTSTTVGGVHFVTTASLGVQIENNFIENRKTSSTKALSSAIAGVTGSIAFNQFFVNSGIVAITTSNLPPMYQCYSSNAAAKNGALDVGAGTST